MDFGAAMVDTAWRSFTEEIWRWRDMGRRVEFWWRDDDAERMTPALSRLFDLVAQVKVPLALAVVPGGCEKGLLDSADPSVAVIQHGVDHLNRAESGGKKTEFPADEPIDAALQRLAMGRAGLEAVAGFRALPVLAPPWNRFTAGLIPHLSRAGYSGISTYGVRATADAAPGLRQVNTHVDLIDWKGGRHFAGEEAVLRQAARHLEMRRTGQADSAEPTGWLTHHAVHDEAAWQFLARLFELTGNAEGVTWLRPADVFGDGARQ